MKVKTMFLAGTVTAMSTLAMGQARETTLTVGKDKIDAVKIEVDAPSKDVEKALQQQLATSGVKPKKSSGSYNYNDVSVTGISQDTVDVWTRVQKNGDKSVIYVAVKDQQGYYLSSGNDTATVEKVKDFLYDFTRAQNYSSKDLEIGMLMDSVAVDQSGYEKYTSEKAKIDNQIKELQNQSQKLEQGFSGSKAEMDRRKQRLDELKSTNTGAVNTGKDEKKSGKSSGAGGDEKSSAKNDGTAGNNH